MKKILLTILVQYYTGVEDSNVLNGIQVKIIDIVMLSMHVFIVAYLIRQKSLKIKKIIMMHNLFGKPQF